MAFTNATRNDLYLRCAIYGPSGSGKTMTALRMAKGIADKLGTKFAVIDTEARSASKYADRINFDVDNLTDKDIDSYLSSMNECVRAGYKVLVIDSLSHAWRELTEEVDRISQNSNNRNSFSAWGKVSPKQKRLVEAILNFPGHIIATMRSKTEWVLNSNEKGRMVPEKMGLAPEQGKGIEYEFDLLVEMNQNHQATVSKDRTGKFQDQVIDKPGEAFGVQLLEWLNGTVETPSAETRSFTNPNTGFKATVVQEETPRPSKDEALKSGQMIINQIAELVKSVGPDGKPVFGEPEKDSMRKIIQGTQVSDTASLRELLMAVCSEYEARTGAKAA